MSYKMHIDEFLRWDGSMVIKWRCDTYSGECYTDADAWEGAATRALADRDDLRARLDAAEADARWALAELVRLDESEGTDTLSCWRDAGLSDAEQEALSVLAFQPSPEGADVLAAVRRIITAGGAR